MVTVEPRKSVRIKAEPESEHNPSKELAKFFKEELKRRQEVE